MTCIWEALHSEWSGGENASLAITNAFLSIFPTSAMYRFSRTLTILVALVAVSFLARSAEAQEGRIGRDLQFGSEYDVTLLHGVPQGDFAASLPQNAWGASFAYRLPLGKGWQAGLNLGMLRYGYHQRQVPFPTVAAVRLDVTTQNFLFGSHLSVRRYAQAQGARPYAEGLVGFNYLFTHTDVSNENGYYREDRLASAVNQSDWTFSGGVGAGVAFTIFDEKRDDGGIARTEVHLGGKYMWGTKATYLQEGPLVDENENGRIDNSEVSVGRSNTSVLQAEIGLTIRFGR